MGGGRAVFPIHIRIRRIRMFLGLLNPHPDPYCNLFVRIQIRILLNKQKNEEKSWFLLLYGFFVTFFLLQNDVNVPWKRNKHNNLVKKNYFLLASWRSLTKRAGSGAGSVSGSAFVSVSQRNGSEDPHLDPYQHVTDPEHWVGGRGGGVYSPI